MSEPEFTVPGEPDDRVLPAWPGDVPPARRRGLPAGGAEADEWIADQIAASVRRDPGIRGRYLEIEVQDRVVILHGVLVSAEAGAAARRLAWATPGVRDVCNQVIVGPQ